MRMIDIACREADGINLPCIIPRDQKRYRERIPTIIERLKFHNHERSDFEISLYTHITIVGSQESLERLRKERKIFKSNLKYIFMGELEVIQDKINELEDLGVEKMVIVVESPDIEDPLSVFCKEIM